MREFIDVTGKTEDEAIQKALSQLGLERDDVSVEVLERAKSGFLGIGSSPAKVRVSYGPEKEEPRPQVTQPKKGNMTKEQKAADKTEKREQKTQSAPQKNAAPKAETAPKKEPAPKAETPAKKEQSAPAATQDLGEEVNDEKAQAIKAFLAGLLTHMEAQAVVKVYQPDGGRYKVILEGDNLGGLIGRRGETLDAIQQLTNYSVNRTGERVRIQLDTEGYREKREQRLEHLAKKVAAKVVKYRRSVTLEPMNAYERHVIHAALQDVAGVTTYSTGTDPNRRIIVAYKGEKNT